MFSFAALIRQSDYHFRLCASIARLVYKELIIIEGVEPQPNWLKFNPAAGFPELLSTRSFVAFEQCRAHEEAMRTQTTNCNSNTKHTAII